MIGRYPVTESEKEQYENVVLFVFFFLAHLSRRLKGELIG